MANANLATIFEGVLRELPRVRESKNGLASALVPSMANYLISAGNYSESERGITKIIGLSELEDTAWWIRILSAGDDLSVIHGQLGAMYSSILAANSAISRFAHLLVRDTDPPEDAIVKNIMGGTELVGRLILTLPEVKGKHSSPSRVTKAIDSVTSMYEGVAVLLNRSESDLIIASCDSGSDKIFDFAGLSDVVEKVKEIIESVWDRVVFHRERKTSESLDLIAKGLPLFEQLAELENDQKLAPEHAQLIRNKITQGVVGFLETGSFIPELKKRMFVDPAKILAPQERLLLPPPGEHTDEGSGEVISQKSDPDMNDLLKGTSPEERAQLEETLRKMRGTSA